MEKEELVRIWRVTSRHLLQTTGLGKTLRATEFFKNLQIRVDHRPDH